MRLVTTLLPRDADDLRRQAARAASPWVEVRLDALPGLEPRGLGALRRAARGRKAIATCRAARDGGLFRASEGEREALLLAALDAGFEAVDVEHDASFLRRLAARARARGAELVVSRHDLAPASAAGGIEPLLEATPPGAIAKYAAAVEGPEDLAALLRACAYAREQGARFAVMGLGDSALRLLAPLLGCELVYCAPPEGPPGAPGQLPAGVVQVAHDHLPPAPRVTGAHRLVVLLGDPVQHSLSPALQNAAFAARGDALVYAATPVARRGLGRALAGLRAMGFAGANVTAPHKEAVLPHLDTLSPEARAARSANTLVHRRGKLAGHTTDGPGALAALREAGAEPQDARALVLGAGGTGRAVAHALAAAGARVRVANRTPERARALARALGSQVVPWKPAALAEAARASAILAQCTSLGAGPRGPPLPARALHDKLAVLDAVYAPGGTRLLRDARARGAMPVPGEALLLHQGALAYKLWTGREPPLGAMRRALARAQEPP